MKTLPLLIAVFILAIILDYCLIKKWKKYRKLVEENRLLNHSTRNIDFLKTAFLGDQYLDVIATINLSIKKLFQLPIMYILGLTAAGIMLLKSSTWIGGTICIVLAMIGFSSSTVVCDNDIVNNKFSGEENQAKQVFSNKTVKILSWILVIIFLVFSVYATARGDKIPSLERAGTAAWLLSLIIGLSIYWNQPFHLKNSFLTQIKKNHQEVMLVVLIIILGFFLRSFLLSEHPYPWSGDEASIGIEAWHIIDGVKSNLFETGWATQPNWSFFPTAMAIKIFGDNIVAVRAPSVVAGTLAVLFTYLAAREMFNSTIAAISSVFLATYSYHIHFSRVGVNNINDSLMSSLMFWLIAWSTRKGDLRLFYLVGVVGGLCVYTYAGTKLVPIIGCCLLLFYLQKKQTSFPIRLKYLIVFLIALTISSVPQIASLSQNKYLLLGRLNQEGILFNGWLANQVASSGKPAFEIILNQLGRTFLVFTTLPARSNFFNSPNPYLTVVSSIFFFLGMTHTWINKSRPGSFAILVWFWTVVIIGGALTSNPPANTRLLMAAPATAIFIGIGIYSFVEILRIHAIVPASRTGVTALIILSFLSIQNIYFYMIEYRSNFYFQDANSEFAMEAGVIAKNLGDEFQIFILGAPRLYSDFPTLAFLVPGSRRTDLSAETYAKLRMPQDQKAAFFATPDNLNLLKKIMADYPNGSLFTFYRITNPKEMLFEYYIFTP